MHARAQEIVEHLGLTPHPEGGFFKETYRARDVIPRSALAASFKGDRHQSTAIYYLLPEGSRSALHRIPSDEVWHLYEGGPLEIFVIDQGGHLERLVLGRDLTKGEAPQHVVPGGTWFGARPLPGSGFALVGCTVAPGFDFQDFEMGSRDELLAAYPKHARLIAELT